MDEGKFNITSSNMRFEDGISWVSYSATILNHWLTQNLKLMSEGNVNIILSNRNTLASIFVSLRTCQRKTATSTFLDDTVIGDICLELYLSF